MADSKGEQVGLLALPVREAGNRVPRGLSLRVVDLARRLLPLRFATALGKFFGMPRETQLFCEMQQ